MGCKKTIEEDEFLCSLSKSSSCGTSVSSNKRPPAYVNPPKDRGRGRGTPFFFLKKHRAKSRRTLLSPSPSDNKTEHNHRALFCRLSCGVVVVVVVVVVVAAKDAHVFRGGDGEGGVFASARRQHLDCRDHTRVVRRERSIMMLIDTLKSSSLALAPFITGCCCFCQRRMTKVLRSPLFCGQLRTHTHIVTCV